LKLKCTIWWVFAIIIPIVFPLLNVWITHFDIYTYVQHFLFMGLCYWSSFGLVYFVRTRFSLRWEKVSIKEIRTEDSVLLEGIGVLQGTLFIYLTLSEDVVSSSSCLLFLRWTIPLVTTLFYLLRGYGAIKNSPKHRFYSSLLLFYYMYGEASLLFNEFALKYLPIYVNSTNITSLYFPSSANLVLFTFIFEISNALSIRYGCK
jgi:hypothetical protein